ncbi:hypothetical protein [Nocardia sp. NPDC127526]|uniref:MmyB family transcriptional regulator n=1 Tax=Nocardia sp. NPDC127526 TaxID=3345393 RepID=UPI00363B0344
MTDAADAGEPSRTKKLPQYSAGSYMRELRERRNLPRAQVALWVRQQPNSLGAIENGWSRATQQTIDLFVQAMSLPAAEERYLRKLAATDIPKKSKARATAKAASHDYTNVISADMQAALDGLAPHAAAWVDPMWRVLASNAAYRRAYPGLEDAGNVLTWFFYHPDSRTTMLDWEGEAALTVAWFRTLISEHGNPEWARDLLNDLSDSEDFARMWKSGSVTFNRKSPYMHLWDSRFGQPYSLLVQITRGPGDLPPMQHFLGIRMPYVGGDELLKRVGRF